MQVFRDVLWKSWAIVVLSGDCTSWMGGWEKQSYLDTKKKDGHAVGWNGHYTTMEIDDVDDGGRLIVTTRKN